MSTDDDIEHMVAFGAGLVSTRENQDQTDLVVVFPDNAVERMRAEAESVAAATIRDC